MILTGHDVHRYIDAGKLVIKPLDPRQVQQNGVDLILDGVVGDPAEFESFFAYLGTTREWIELPDDVMAFVELRSTWARQGVQLPPTIVDVGFHGTLTLEITWKPVFLGRDTAANIPVPYGQRFAHLIFAKCSGPGDPYRGKYQGQLGATQAIADPKEEHR